MIVWGGRQTLGRWRAAGKYRWRRQPEGQYSLLYNLSPAALNYLPATAVASCECLERKVIEELGGIEARRDISAIEDQTVCPLKFAFALQPTEVEKKKLNYHGGAPPIASRQQIQAAHQATQHILIFARR